MRQYVGETIDGRFEILRVIGQGGMGIVFEARQIALARKCALKLLLPSAVDIPTVKQRFAREARLAAQVKHPNVVGVLDTGTTGDGLPYIAMDYLEGESLDRTLMRDRVLPWGRARHIVLQICSALAEAHSMGIVHRDLKPGNCMRITHAGDPDFIKLVDFGIAKALWGEERQTKLTQRDMPIGTVDYMAYEQAYGLDDCDHRIDIWSVAVILYELVSGCLPFRGSQMAPPVQRLAAIITRDPLPLTSCIPAGTTPEGVDDLIERALVKDRDFRFQSIIEFRAALEALPDILTPVPVVVATGSPQEYAGPTEINPIDVVDARNSQAAPEPPGEPVSSPAPTATNPGQDPDASAAQDDPVDATLSRTNRTNRLLVLSLVLLVFIGVTLTAKALWGPDEPAPREKAPLAMAPVDPQPSSPSTATPTKDASYPPNSTDPPTPTPPPSPIPDPPLNVPPTKKPDPPPNVPLTKKSDPPKPRTSKVVACAAVKTQLAAVIRECIGGRSITYDLSIAVDSGGVVKSVNTSRELLAEDPGFQCIQGKLARAKVDGILGPLTFPCQVKR